MSEQTTASVRINRRKPLPYDPHSEIIRVEHIDRATGLSAATVWRKRRAGTFPEPIRLSDHARGWRRAEINAWLDAQAREAR